MPTEFFYSDTTNSAPITYNEWTLAAGSDKGSATRPGGGRAGPMTHDDAASYIRTTGDTGNREQEISIDWPGPIASVTALTAGFRHRFQGSGNSTRAIAFIRNGLNGAGIISVQNSTTTWATSGPADAMAKRPGGGSWTSADFLDNAPNDTRFYLSHVGSVAGAITDDTSAWGGITYETPSGGFMFLLGLAGTMALPFVGTITSFREFTRFLEWRRDYHPRHTIMTGEEVRQAWDELRGYRFPVQFRLGVV